MKIIDRIMFQLDIEMEFLANTWKGWVFILSWAVAFSFAIEKILSLTLFITIPTVILQMVYLSSYNKDFENFYNTKLKEAKP